MKIIDNVSDRLGDDLKREITPGSKVRIAASTFSIFAFEALRKELDQVSELEFIFTSPAFVTAKVTDKLRKERREFSIPSDGRGEPSVSGSEFEIRLRNKLTHRAIARECADWVRRKVQFRSNSPTWLSSSRSPRCSAPRRSLPGAGFRSSGRCSTRCGGCRWRSASRPDC